MYMSNIGPPNWWLRDKMIELTDKTLDVINKTEEKLNTKINKISETQYITNNTYNTYNNINMTDIIDNGATNSLRANIVSTSSLRAKTERQRINVTTIPGDNDNIYRITVNKAQPEKLIVSFQENINGILVYSNSGLNDIFTGNISFTNASNIIGKYSLHISKNGIIPILPEQNLDNILTIIGDINSSTINSWDNSQEGVYIFTLNNYIINPGIDANPSTIIFNGSLVFTELVGSIPLVIGNTDEKSIEIKSLHTKLEGNLLDIENNFTIISSSTLNISSDTLNTDEKSIEIKSLHTKLEGNILDIENNFTNIAGNTLNISSNALSINSMNTNIQGQDINIGTNNVSHNLNIGSQNNNTNMYSILSGNLNTNLLRTNDITVRNILIPVVWKDISTSELLQVKIYNNNKLQLIYYNSSNGIITYEDSSTILRSKLHTFIQENYSYLGSNFINQNLFSLDSNIFNLDKFAIKIYDITNSNDYLLTKIISVTNVPTGNSGNIIELELDSNITTDYSNTPSLPFEAELKFIIQDEHNILNINNPSGKINLQATEGAFNFSGNLTINAGNITEVVRQYVDISSNKIILNGGVTGLTLTPDASIEAQHHEGPSSYGTITYSGPDKEWNINPSITSTRHITSGTYITVGTDLTVSNSATISNKLYVEQATTMNNSLYVKEATTLNNNLYVEEATTMNNSLYVEEATTMNNSLYVEKSSIFNDILVSNQTITGIQGLFTNSGLFIKGTIPLEKNDASTGININGFYWNKDQGTDPELVIPIPQKIIDKDYKRWGGTDEPTYSNPNRLVSILLNNLILNSWDTYHIITRGSTGIFHFRTIAYNSGLVLDGKNIKSIKVFNNSSIISSPILNPTISGFAYSGWTQTNLCTQISLFSFIETGTSNTLILNIHTVDNKL